MPGERVYVVVRDTHRRSRLTVFLRLILAIPHLVWLWFWSLGVLLVLVPTWLATLVAGRPPRALHHFLGAYVRYTLHLGAYLSLAADPWPTFNAAEGYPVDVVLPPPRPQSRWTVAFRLVLAVPAVLLAATLAGSNLAPVGPLLGLWLVNGVVLTVAVLGWFACLALGRMPAGLRDLAVYCLGYGAQATAYLLLVAERYPDADPGLVLPRPEPPPHPVRLHVDERLRRSRLTVFFRLLLALPHLVWLTLWSAAAIVVAVAGWVVALALGRLPEPLHRFLAAYVRYTLHVYAFVTLVANPFPGFVGAAGSYPVDAELARPERQRRLVTLFRLLLALPALAVTSALANALALVAFLGWFAGLATGRMPHGLARLGAAALRYGTQTSAYLLLLTGRYPDATPTLATPSPEPAAAPAPAPS